MNNLLRYLFSLDRKARIYLRLIIESLLMLIVYLFWLDTFSDLVKFNSPVHFLNLFLWFYAYHILGLHKDRLRFSSLNSYVPIVKISLFVGLIFMIESSVLNGADKVIFSFFSALISFNMLVGFRIFARQLIRREASRTRENILVYGTSDVAIDLVNAMAFGKKYNVIGFVSDIPQNIGSIAGLPVIPFEEVENFANAFNCKLVVLASQSLSSARQTEILLSLDKLGLSVSYVPTIDRAFDYEIQLKAVNPEEVLGRASEVPFDEFVHIEIHNKVILVTGAGGSIGSEICRQILRYQPTKLIILELNELALYTLEQELSELLDKADSQTQVSYQLGSVTEHDVLNRIFKEQKIDIVYHAAAYKHVPIVEENIIAGVKNNVFGTKCVANFAHRFNVDKFVLVSTDKAVRPTNVMGASKRLAELVIQDLAKASETIFTMVRFGNVLGSSGSVIPKFKSQINAGGPITVTHAEITRYFMSIPEAAHLVLNAGTFASGGDVFLLDMGDPVKILELAKTMIRQHGLQPVLAAEIENRQKRDNEIAIEFTGLRPGEKLYEELLVDGVVQSTPNPKIFKSHDGVFEDIDLTHALQLIKQHIEDNLPMLVVDQLCKLPLAYQPTSRAELKHEEIGTLLQANVKNGKNAEKQQLPSSLIIAQDQSSFLHRIVSSKLCTTILHRYFLVSRGMTLGVRVVVKNQKDEVLIVRHTYLQGWHLPGGGVDHGEDVETAAKREVFEETGISDLNALRFICLTFNNAVSDRDHVAFFEARTDELLSKKRSAEIAEIRFVSRDTATEMIIPEHKKFILDNA